MASGSYTLTALSIFYTHEPLDPVDWENSRVYVVTELSILNTNRILGGLYAQKSSISSSAFGEEQSQRLE